jgi:RecA/RadA recombinase/intein/homing endonuclease
MARKKNEEDTEERENYFLRKDKPIKFIDSGCTLLNKVLGGGWAIGRISNVVGDSASGKCVKDGYILNNDGMTILDKKLENYPEGISELKQNLSIDKNSKVTSTHSYKEKVNKTYKITTRHGFEIECTPNHPILIFNENCEEEMIKAKDLKINNIAIIAKETNSFGSNDEVDENLAFLLGCLVANGQNPKFGSIVVSTYKSYLQEKLYKIGKDLGFNPYIKKDKVAIYNKEFSFYIWEEFFDKKENFTARYKFVPKQILESPKHIQICFLRGLIDCDSSYDKKKSCLEYSTASEVLSKQIHLMLLNLGVLSNRSYDDGAYIGSKFYDHKYWTIYFGGKYLNKYAEIVGSDKYSFVLSTEKNVSEFDNIPYLHSRMVEDREKLKKVLGWSKNGKLKDGTRFSRLKLFSWNNASYNLLDRFINLHEKYSEHFDISFYKDIAKKNYHYDPIVSIEEIYYPEGEYVFDVHVPEAHRFWCNGFISHNTLIAIQAIKNFYLDYPDGNAYYLEAEAAFDYDYAKKIGLPLEKVTFVDEEIETVEGMYENILKVIKDNKENKPIIYIVDSLDSLSDEVEIKEEDITKGTYNLGKAKQLSKIFRLMTRKVERSNLHLMIISQVRANIGVMFGKKYTRAAGKALDFYSSQIIWLAIKDKINKTIKGQKRDYGVWTKAKCEKNKVGMSFRECEFPIIYSFGINDLWAILDWLNDIKNALEDIGLETFSGRSKDKDIEEFAEKLYREHEDEKIFNIIQTLITKTNTIWDEIEKEIAPNYTDYRG